MANQYTNSSVLSTRLYGPSSSESCGLDTRVWVDGAENAIADLTTFRKSIDELWSASIKWEVYNLVAGK